MCLAQGRSAERVHLLNPPSQARTFVLCMGLGEAGFVPKSGRIKSVLPLYGFSPHGRSSNRSCEPSPEGLPIGNCRKRKGISPVSDCGGKWWLRPESNWRHADFQSAALPTELHSLPWAGNKLDGPLSAQGVFFGSSIQWNPKILKTGIGRRLSRGIPPDSRTRERRIQRPEIWNNHGLGSRLGDREILLQALQQPFGGIDSLGFRQMLTLVFDAQPPVVSGLENDGHHPAVIGLHAVARRIKLV